ncbi:FecR family protein, partial [Bacteroidota bacterium]
NSLIYSDEKKTDEIQPLIYNELKTPRGGGYNLVLADGTEVWVNAGSSLKFPVSFTDSTRKVFLTGEAYFDVSHNGKPFIVSSGSMDITVLGTSFNVSAYPDELSIKTTLVEGKVQIDVTGNLGSTSASEILMPNDQAVILRDGSTIKINQVNTSQYTSWIDGKIEFTNDNLDMVMKRLARWYDFEYEFENNLARDYHFSARISNIENVSSILEMLEMTTDVKFELRNNTIVIL